MRVILAIRDGGLGPTAHGSAYGTMNGLSLLCLLQALHVPDHPPRAEVSGETQLIAPRILGSLLCIVVHRVPTVNEQPTCVRCQAAKHFFLLFDS